LPTDGAIPALIESGHAATRQENVNMAVVAAVGCIAIALAIMALRQGNYLARRLVEVEGELAKLRVGQ
jgi:hypothetical protein